MRLLIPLGVSISLICAYFGVSTAYGPNRSFAVIEEAESSLNVTQLAQATEAVVNWPQWFSGNVAIRMIDFRGEAYPDRDQTLAAGGWLRITWLDPSKFTAPPSWLVEVPHYDKLYHLKIRLAEDKLLILTQKYSQLNWAIEFKELPNGTKIRITTQGQAIHPKSRLLARFAPWMIPGQLIGPNLNKLAALKNTLPVISVPQSRR